MRSFAALASAILALTSTTYALPHSLIKPRQNNDAAITAAVPPRLVAYIQTFRSVDGGPLSLLPLLQENTGVTHVLLSAVHLNEQPGDINLNDHPPSDPIYDTLWSEAKQLQEGGIKVMMMLGGAARGTFQRLSGDDESFHTYYDPLLTILRKYNIQGLDIDIEESVPISMPLRLLRQLNTDLGPDFLLTMAPVASALLGNGGNGLHGFNQKEMDDQATDSTRPNGKLVSWYNAQFYNGWGDASSSAMYDRIISEGGWDSARVVMGVLTNPGDGGSGFVKLPTLKSVIGSLGAKYASFGCAVGWEYWAAGTGDGLQYPWQWVKALGDVISMFGKEPASAEVQQPPAAASSSNATMTEPATPWPSQMQTLESVGAGHWDSLRALNMTNGDTKAAGDILGVTQLIDDILGQAEDIVSGVLDGLALV